MSDNWEAEEFERDGALNDLEEKLRVLKVIPPAIMSRVGQNLIFNELLLSPSQNKQGFRKPPKVKSLPEPGGIA